MVSAEDAIDIYRNLTDSGIAVWLTGGWGIDALLGKQTRPHKDLDVIVLLDDIVRIRKLLEGDGYRLKDLWSEDKVVIDPHGTETSTAFVMAHPDDREVDLHAIVLDDRGNGIPAWNHDEGWNFATEDLAGEGVIAGVAVHCLSAQIQAICHTGYELPDYQVRDMELLQAKFGIERE
jgi:lincosamide nucleotidyltransferase A/C/D/E